MIAISKILNAATLALILTSQFPQLLDVVRPGGIMGMLILFGVSLGAGWIAGGPGSGDRKAVLPGRLDTDHRPDRVREASRGL
jgi:BASS family bile acid:Na+ symporter